MPARPRTALKAASQVGAEPKPVGTFARLMAEANERRPKVEPYVIEDVEPPIVINLPDSVESQIELAELFTSSGEFATSDARRVLRILCGDAFPRVWELLRHQHVSVLAAFIADVGGHFGGLFVGGDEFPGGSEASPTA